MILPLYLERLNGSILTGRVLDDYENTGLSRIQSIFECLKVVVRRQCNKSHRSSSARADFHGSDDELELRWKRPCYRYILQNVNACFVEHYVGRVLIIVSRVYWRTVHSYTHYLRIKYWVLVGLDWKGFFDSC